jgi:hypothetical protein
MYKKHRIAIIISLAIMLSALVLPLNAFMTDTFAGSSTVYPYLSAVITSPANGAVIQVGNCFTVTAVISATCPSSAKNNDWFAKPVYAFTPSASSVGATISINGNATVGSGQTSQISIGTLNCGSQTTISWLVCCNGRGNATITITPFGNGYITLNTDQNGIMDKIVKPAFAEIAPPIPADRITSASIIVVQVESSLRSDAAQPGGTGPQAMSWAQPADNRITTAFVQQDQVLSGEPVRIMANVSNKGDLPGSYTATLTVNNQIEATKKVTVPGGASIPIEFTVTKDKPGNYEADVNGQKVYFTVTGKQTSSPFDVKIIAGIVIGILLLTSLILLIRRLSTR